MSLVELAKLSGWISRYLKGRKGQGFSGKKLIGLAPGKAFQNNKFIRYFES